MDNELNFEKGLEELIRMMERRMEAISQRPFFVGVYGEPNSGKSYLMEQLVEYFSGKGYLISASSGAPVIDSFKAIKNMGKWLEVGYYNSIIQKTIMLLHCGWYRLNVPDEKDPNHMAKSVFGRGLDLNIALYNPNFGIRPDGRYDVKYDLIIANPNSKKKAYGQNTSP